mmetsp:Transcript_12399/g.24994  ORF Transcript_12399/g.24994 Transcript_12399/m.24994 type:complete len:518 (+) Transcript_12399:206-1759(+)
MRPVNVLAAASILLPTTSAFSFAPKARHQQRPQQLAVGTSRHAGRTVASLRMMGGYGDETSNDNYYYNPDDGYYYYYDNEQGSGSESQACYQNGDDGYYYYYPEDAPEAPSAPGSRQRRSLLSNLAAGSALLASASAANAAPSDGGLPPTKIELDVDTEYLLRVLDYFQGDMRQVLGVLIKNPTTRVQIDAPDGGKKAVRGMTAKDAILRALYSYDNPDDYADQASWLNVRSNGSAGLVEFLTKKRYNFDLDVKGIADRYAYLRSDAKPVTNGNSAGAAANGDLTSKTTTISLSNLEAAVGLAVASYPLAYGYYNYESYLEEREKLAKKKAMEAKKKAAAEKAKAAAKTDKPAAAAAKKEKPAKKEPVAAAAPAPSKTDGEAMDGEFSWSETELASILEKKPKAKAAEPAPEAEPSLSAEFIEKAETAAKAAFVEQQQLQPPKKAKKSSGGMDAYAAQMAAMTKPPAPAAAPEAVEEVTEEIAAATFSSSAAPEKKKKSSGGMDAYEAQMRAMMQRK